MSSKPSPDGVAKLRELATLKRNLENEMESLRPTIKRWNEIPNQIKAADKEIIKQLENMDCRSSGNFGYEGRVLWMLAELVTPTPLFKQLSDVDEDDDPKKDK